MPEQPSMPPTTTSQEDMTTAGQRRINLIWEYTQAVIALVVVVSSVIVIGVRGTMPDSMIALLFTVISFYFSRTNHAAIGGIGPKADKAQPYAGR